MKKSIVIFCMVCAIAAVPVPEERPKSIELLKIPLAGDKVSIFSFIIVAMQCTAYQAAHEEKKKENLEILKLIIIEIFLPRVLNIFFFCFFCTQTNKQFNSTQQLCVKIFCNDACFRFLA